MATGIHVSHHGMLINAAGYRLRYTTPCMHAVYVDLLNYQLDHGTHDNVLVKPSREQKYV